MTSCLSPYSALSLVRQRIHALRQSTELFEEAHMAALVVDTGSCTLMAGLDGDVRPACVL